MSAVKAVIYLSQPSGDDGQCRVWTVLRDADGNLQELSGCAPPDCIDEGVPFSERTLHKVDSPHILAKELITAKRLFEGYRIHSRPFRLDTETCFAVPDTNAPALTGTEGEFLLKNPIYHPTARALGSPKWFF